MTTKKFIGNLECPHCFRPYKNKGYYDRHVSACELLHKSSSQRNDDIECNAYIPDSKKLYEMILVLVEKNKVLEKKVEELSKGIVVKNKPVHMKEWLEQNYTTAQTFDDFMSRKTISDDDYKEVCKVDYVKGLGIILKKMFPCESLKSLPIQAFAKKSDVLFIKTGDGWSTMTSNEIEGLISVISKQLFTKFVSWQESNKHRMTDDSYNEEYMDMLQKILGSHHKSDTFLLKIKRNFYKHLGPIHISIDHV